MSLNALIHSLLRRTNVINEDSERTRDVPKLATRLWDVFLRTFDLGFTAFGGPPVHFQIFHRRFVDGNGKTPWIDEQVYQELFGISQALPGPASTKMLFNIAQIHAGLVPALFVFFLWSFPGAVAMYGLSLGVQRISDTLPGPAYAFLSGLNAAVVGIIALSAIQLARKAITDPLTRILVVVGGCAGMCYNALWYFPVLLILGGTATITWDSVGQLWLRKLKQRRLLKRRSTNVLEPGIGPEPEGIPMESIKEVTRPGESLGSYRRHNVSVVSVVRDPSAPGDTNPDSATVPTLRIDTSRYRIPVKMGVTLIILFFVIFAVFMSIRGAIHSPPLLLSLYNNMLLAGTIIFGGGPVVIPLLRDYVVDPGWVSPRDFLLGLAVIQAMPGPNFNFVIYLGALTAAGPASNKSIPSIVGAVLAFVGIFMPGLWLSIGFQSVWQSLRRRREVASILRGLNATAVGFIFTAVYRLWEIGYLTSGSSQGISLGQQPWWLVITASTFTSVEWFAVPPPVAILVGGTAGLGWWGAVGHSLT